AGIGDAHAAALVALSDVALAPAVTVGVDGQAKGVVALVDGPADMVVNPRGVAAHIKLKDFETVAGSLGGLVEPGMRDRAQDHAVAKGARRLRDSRAAARLENFERADRRAQYRDAQLLAKQRTAAIDVRYVAQYPRTETDRVKRQAVARQGRPGLGTTE